MLWGGTRKRRPWFVRLAGMFGHGGGGKAAMANSGCDFTAELKDAIALRRCSSAWSGPKGGGRQRNWLEPDPVLDLGRKAAAHGRFGQVRCGQRPQAWRRALWWQKTGRRAGEAISRWLTLAMAERRRAGRCGRRLCGWRRGRRSAGQGGR